LEKFEHLGRFWFPVDKIPNRDDRIVSRQACLIQQGLELVVTAATITNDKGLSRTGFEPNK
jgi:hypothetical protein